MGSVSLVPCGEAISVTAGGIHSTAKPGHSKITRSKNMKSIFSSILTNNISEICFIAVRSFQL